MREFSWLVIVVATVFLLVGCNPGCDLENTVATGVSATISTGLQCSNTTQVTADVTALLNKTGICTQATAKGGIVGGVICPLLASLAVEEFGKIPPAAWGCNPTLASDNLETLLLKACNAISF